MTADTTETRPLPTTGPPPTTGPGALPGLPLPGDYQAPADQCVVELSARTGPLTTLRVRFGGPAVRLTVDEDAERCTLQMTADASAVRLPGRPFARRGLLGRRGLDATRNPELQLFVEAFTQTGDDRLTADGLLAIRGTTHPTRLDARVVERADDRLILLATADVPYRAVRRASGFTLPRLTPAGRLRLLIAADLA